MLLLFAFSTKSYDSYKNYKAINLSSNSSKGNILLKIYQYDFALNDLSLYLDLHPEDKDVYKRVLFFQAIHWLKQCQHLLLLNKFQLCQHLKIKIR